MTKREAWATWNWNTRNKQRGKDMIWTIANILAEDGKQMKLDCEAMGIKSIVEEVDRHSRMLQKEQDIANA